MKVVSVLRAWVLVFSCGCVFAGSAVAAPNQEAAIRAHMAFLADDLLEGRVAGSRGYDLAARYVASQFESIGLEPFGDKGTWLQSVPLVEGQRVPLAATLLIESPTGSYAATPLEDFVPGVDFQNADSSVVAEVVFVGYGVTAPELGYDDFANGTQLAGKIALVLSGAPPSFPSSKRAYYGSGLVKTENLATRGAVGVISTSTLVDEKRTPWQRVLQQSWVSGMRWLDASGAVVNSFPGIRVNASVNHATAEKLLAGGPQPLAAVLAAAEASKPQSFALPNRVSMSRKTALRKLSSANVVGLLRGSHPRLRDEYLVFTAHLDHIGRGAAIAGDSIYNGAMDNASGVAVMIEAARQLVRGARRPKRSILFVALTAEEKGLLGAEYFATNPPVPVAQLIANINMDMPVTPADMAEFVAYGADHSSLGPIAKRAVRAEGRRLAPDPNPEEVIFVRSDQYAFVRAGIPALYIDNAFAATDPKIDGVALVREFMRKHYHQPSDDLSRPIDYGTLARLARINARIGREVGNARDRPQWNKGDFFGLTFGPDRTAK